MAEPGNSTFLTVSLSTGTFSAGFTFSQFFNGIFFASFGPQPFSANPPRSGPAFSCPVIVVEPPVVEPPPPQFPPPNVPPDCACPPPPSPTPNPTPGPTPPPQPPPTGGPGWNPGGVEWFSECQSSGGLPRSYPTVGPEELFEGVTETQMWLHLKQTVGPTFLERTLLFGFEHPIPDPPSYFEGFKSGKLRTIGSLTNALSNDNGDLIGSSVSIGLDDKDRETRSAIDDPPFAGLDGAEGMIPIVSEARRRLRGDATVLFRGRVNGYGLGTGLTAGLSLEDVMTSEYGPLNSRRFISDRKLTRGLFPGIPVEHVGLHQPIIMGIVGDWGAVLPLGTPPTVLASGVTLPVEKGIVPVIEVGARTMGAYTNVLGAEWIEFFVSGHALEGFDVYGADDTNTFRQRVPDSAYGDYILAPKKPGWPFATDYFDLTDADTGLEHRVSLFFVRADHVIATSHRAKQISIALNVCGMEDVGDGSGNVITGLFNQWQFLLDNYIFTSPGYYTGLFTDVPYWQIPPQVRMTDSDSFAAAQALSAVWIGGEGYTGGFVLNGELARDVNKRLAVTAFANVGWSRAGQFMVSLADDTMSLVGLPRVWPPSKLRAGVPSIFGTGSIENPLSFVYDKDYDTGKWRADQVTLSDPVAQTYTGYIEHPSLVECSMTRELDTAQHAMARRLLWHKYPLPAVTIEMGLGGLDLELGDVILLTAEDGIGPGYVDTPVRLLSRTYLPEQRRVVWQGVVLSRVLPNGHTGVLAQRLQWNSPATWTWETTSPYEWRS